MGKASQRPPGAAIPLGGQSGAALQPLGPRNATVACSSVLVPGPNDYPLYYDSSNSKVLSAVATMNTTPLPLNHVGPQQVPLTPQSLAPLLNPHSSTGY